MIGHSLVGGGGGGSSAAEPSPAPVQNEYGAQPAQQQGSVTNYSILSLPRNLIMMQLLEFFPRKCLCF